MILLFLFNMYKKEGARGSHFPLLPIPHYITTSTLLSASMGLLVLGTIQGFNYYRASNACEAALNVPTCNLTRLSIS